MSKWKIRDAVLEFDWNDYDDTMRFHEAEEALNKKNLEKALNKPNITQWDQTKLYCEAWNQYFDTVFGVGASDKLFNGKRNRVLTTTTICAYTEFMKKAREEANEADVEASKQLDKAYKDLSDFLKDKMVN